MRGVDRRAHGEGLRGDLASSVETASQLRQDALLDDAQLRALGTVLVLVGAAEGFPLKLDSLESWSRHKQRRPRWMLLSVTPRSEGEPEQATVWVSDEYRANFLKLFEDFLNETTAEGRPKNRELVANIATIRAAVVSDLWQSQVPIPEHGDHWWELWLRPADDAVALARAYAATAGLHMSQATLKLNDRTVIWVRGTWASLQALPFTAVPVAEIRRPEFVDTVEDLSADEQSELTEDLAARIRPAASGAPAVCHLDTGVRRTHVLLAGSLAASDHHSITGASGDDVRNHGTLMAGLALFGDLDSVILGTGHVALVHRLESVKILPDRGPGHDPVTYGVVTAQAAAIPEAVVQRARAYCMPITATTDGGPGEPTLWSASVDALAMGVDVGLNGNDIELLTPPNVDAARLFVISAGNVDPSDHSAAYRDACDLSTIEDPAQAWNALTVGAHTELVQSPTDPTFMGWTPVADQGDISPHSRTSVRFSHRKWPVKPDICMEGGNLLTNGVDFHEAHPLLTVRTTDAGSDVRIGSAHATSAATAQAARLAAKTMAAYPDYWPETVRGLVVHSARWTQAMRAEIDAATSKSGKHTMLRRYGWGVPTETALLGSRPEAVTLVSQDSFVPFEGRQYQARRFRLHRLPWPADVLRGLGGAAKVELRVTLSYFIEPTASRRGWRRRYSYASHGLRFELKAPLESLANFVDRVNRVAEDEEGGQARPSGGGDRWLIGPNQRNQGSLHQDVWEGTGPDLAECGLLAVYPTGGWWKNNQRRDRVDQSVRYALIVSLLTPEQGVDLYTPIANELAVPISLTT